jgi:propionate CoA-transferase
MPHPALPFLRNPEKGKVVTAAEAVRLIRDGDTLATGGFVGIGFAEEIAVALEERFLTSRAETPGSQGSPRDLTLVYAAGQGDGKEKGLNHLGHAGLVKRVIGGHWGLAPKLQHLAIANEIEAYNLPQGVITHLFRDIAARRPAHITRVGMGTFVDPLNGGGKLNPRTTEELVERATIAGQECLVYKTFPIHVGIIRATTGDPDGNLTMEKEALTLEALAIAMAARNSGGVVIAQVERVAESGSLNPRQVKTTGRPSPRNTTRPFPAKSRCRWPRSADPDERAQNHRPARGLGTDAERHRQSRHRDAGGRGQHRRRREDHRSADPDRRAGRGRRHSRRGLDFGAATNVQAIIDQPNQFDFYDGGGLDMRFWGWRRSTGRAISTSRNSGPRIAGAGGFINISQNARKVVFAGTFTTAPK